jgi:hypothetical protein
MKIGNTGNNESTGIVNNKDDRDDLKIDVSANVANITALETLQSTYMLTGGSRVMAGDIDLDGNDIVGVNEIKTGPNRPFNITQTCNYQRKKQKKQKQKKKGSQVAFCSDCLSGRFVYFSEELKRKKKKKKKKKKRKKTKKKLSRSIHTGGQKTTTWNHG